MQGKFVSNLILIVVLNLFVKPVSLFWIDAGVQNRVGAEEYGIYYVLLNVTVLFNILLDLGINNFTTKNIAQYPHLAGRYFSKTWSFRLVAFVGYTLCTVPLVFFLDLSGKDYFLLGILLLNQLLIGMIAYARSHLTGLLMFRWDSLFSILDRFLLILACGFIFLSSHQFKIEWFVYCLFGSYAASAALAYMVLADKVGLPSFKLDRIFIISIVRRSLPYALLILLMMLYTRIDTFMIALLSENHKVEVGIYAQGFRVLDAFYMFAMLFAGLLLPIFSRQIHQREENYKLMRLASQILVGGSIWLCWLCFHQSETILGWIYTNNIEESSPSFQWLMLSFIGVTIAILNSTLLTAFGELKKLNIAAGISIVMNIILNCLFIPKEGAEGAAKATFYTQCLIALVYFVQAKNYFGKNAYFWHLGHLAIYGASLMILSQFWSEKIQFWILPTVGLIGLIVFRIWQPKKWMVLLQKVQNTVDTEETQKIKD